MLLEYWGHSFFTVTTEKGTVVAFDPYGEFYDYPKRRIAANVCVVSHHHHDHDGVSSLTGEYKLIDTAGKVQPAPDVRLMGIPCCHDHHGGAHRGQNLMFVLESEGLRIAHLGDLGHIPTPAQVRELGRVDVLLLPVGGYYTIDAAEAAQVRQLIRPRLTIPMHYKTDFDPDMPIAGVETFLQQINAANAPHVPFLRLTARDMSERPEVLVMDVG